MVFLLYIQKAVPTFQGGTLKRSGPDRYPGPIDMKFIVIP